MTRGLALGILAIGCAGPAGADAASDALVPAVEKCVKTVATRTDVPLDGWTNTVPLGWTDLGGGSEEGQSHWEAPGGTVAVDVRIFRGFGNEQWSCDARSSRGADWDAALALFAEWAAGEEAAGRGSGRTDIYARSFARDMQHGVAACRPGPHPAHVNFAPGEAFYAGPSPGAWAVNVIDLGPRSGEICGQMQ